ncbi:hypothetical protein F5148DRAFT_1200205 [Russula earlei]|uniref:Uncharacterized protein n=1 Tax=Russula earlei TaxID=71964 RepID=A0ACC0U8Q4_9AGAM|nr:hypothetical protein F5148DRAFT_1200205 [Russula earlei]
MRFLDIFSLILAILGTYGIFVALRFLLPRNYISVVSTELNEAEILLNHLVANNVIPNGSDHRNDLAILHNEYLRMRTESHRSPGFFPQLRLTFLCGLTYRLYDLSSRIGGFQREVELAVGERQFISLTTAQSGTTTALPASATSKQPDFQAVDRWTFTSLFVSVMSVPTLVIAAPATV